MPTWPLCCAVEMWDLVESYGALKRRAGKLDFVDLLIWPVIWFA